MIGSGFRGMLSGFGAINAPSLTTTGAVSASSFLSGDGSAGTPSYGFASVAGMGWYKSGAGTMTAVVSSTAQVAVSNGDVTLALSDLRARAAVVLGGEVTPSQITADQHDYAGVTSTKTIARISTDASRTITGFSVGFFNRIIVVQNVGAQDLVLAHQNLSSTDINRIITTTAASLTLTAGQAAMLIYDDTADRWRAYKLT